MLTAAGHPHGQPSPPRNEDCRNDEEHRDGEHCGALRGDAERKREPAETEGRASVAEHECDDHHGERRHHDVVQGGCGLEGNDWQRREEERAEGGLAVREADQTRDARDREQRRRERDDLEDAGKAVAALERHRP